MDRSEFVKAREHFATVERAESLLVQIGGLAPKDKLTRMLAALPHDDLVRYITNGMCADLDVARHELGRLGVDLTV
jgi:hypothetical protein